MNWQHIYPLNDEQEHDTESHPLSVIGSSPLEGTPYVIWDGCACNPRVDFDNQIVVHNAFDCREVVEEAEEILKSRYG